MIEQGEFEPWPYRQSDVVAELSYSASPVFNHQMFTEAGVTPGVLILGDGIEVPVVALGDGDSAVTFMRREGEA